jgi:hypothetical protein
MLYLWMPDLVGLPSPRNGPARSRGLARCEPGWPIPDQASGYHLTARWLPIGFREFIDKGEKRWFHRRFWNPRNGSGKP